MQPSADPAGAKAPDVHRLPNAGHWVLAAAAAALTIAAAVRLAAAPAWPTAFSEQPGPPACTGTSLLDTAVMRSAAPRYAHAVTALRLRDGRIRAFWYEGHHELSPDTKIWSATYDGRGWSPARSVVGSDETQAGVGQYVRKLGNAVAFRDADGAIVLVYVSVGLGGWSASRLNATRSADEGETWSAPRRLVTTPTFNISTLVRGPVVPAEGGSVLVPTYHSFVRHFAEMLLLDRAGRVRGRRRIGTNIAASQPQIAVLDARRARAFMRTAPTPFTLVSDTGDAGWSWTAIAKSGIPNFDKPVAVTRVDPKTWLMV